MKHGLWLLLLMGCDDPRVRTIDVDPVDASETDGSAPEDAAVDVSADAERDAAPAVDAAPEACVITVHALDPEGVVTSTAHCAIGAGDACMALAVCVCEALDRPDADACVEHLLLPRGAITLADFCYQGIALDEVLAHMDWRDALGTKVELEWTAACADRLAE